MRQGRSSSSRSHVKPEWNPMAKFYQPDVIQDFDSPFVRDGNDKLIRRSYWLDMDDRTPVMVMTKGIGAKLANDEKRAHLADIKRVDIMLAVDDEVVIKTNYFEFVLVAKKEE